MSIKYGRESLLPIHFQLLFISWPLTAIHIIIHTHLLLFTGVTKKLLLLTQQHVEDNVCACIVNCALYDGIINVFKDLQWLNRCTREMCLQIREGSECWRCIFMSRRRDWVQISWSRAAGNQLGFARIGLPTGGALLNTLGQRTPEVRLSPPGCELCGEHRSPWGPHGGTRRPDPQHVCCGREGCSEETELLASNRTASGEWHSTPLLFYCQFGGLTRNSRSFQDSHKERQHQNSACVQRAEPPKPKNHSKLTKSLSL